MCLSTYISFLSLPLSIVQNTKIFYLWCILDVQLFFPDRARTFGSPSPPNVCVCVCVCIPLSFFSSGPHRHPLPLPLPLTLSFPLPIEIILAKDRGKSQSVSLSFFRCIASPVTALFALTSLNFQYHRVYNDSPMLAWGNAKYLIFHNFFWNKISNLKYKIRFSVSKIVLLTFKI